MRDKPVYKPPAWIWPMGCATWVLIFLALERCVA